MDKQVDILIIGGGLVGATLLLALRGLGYSALLVDGKAPVLETSLLDTRSIALSPASCAILDTLGLWQAIQPQATPIETIHVSQQYRFGTARLHALPAKPLGYVVAMHHLQQVVDSYLDKTQLLIPSTLVSLNKEAGLATIETAGDEITVSFQLLVAADGTESTVRKLCGLPLRTKEYQQSALVANIGLRSSHQQVAYERFTSNGALALLPLQKHTMALVWALPPLEAKRIAALDDQAFLQELQQAFGYRLGRLKQVGPRLTYPLRQAVMPKQVEGSIVFVGNAAHTLHPVAGQGFNLGLRDVATLAQCIAKEGLHSAMLINYLTERQSDQRLITHFTDKLIQVFGSRLPGLALARSLGLVAFDNVPLLQKSLRRYASGYGGCIPDLVCGIALNNREEHVL